MSDRPHPDGEGYEFMVGQTQVIYKEIGGRKAEPIENLSVDVPSDLAGTVIEYAATRKGDMVNMEQRGGRTLIQFRIPSRGLIGFRGRMLRATGGETTQDRDVTTPASRPACSTITNTGARSGRRCWPLRR